MNQHLRPLLASLILASTPLVAQDPGPSGEMVALANLDASTLKAENDATVAVEELAGAKVIRMTYPESKGYPGFDCPAPEGVWDLSAFQGVAVGVTNESPVKAGIALRVENAGDWQKSPWNAAVIWLEPGATGTVKVKFGESYDQPGFALDPKNVNKIKIFVNPPKEGGSIVVHNITAF